MRLLLVLLGLLVCACEARPAPSRLPPAARSDKQALFASASLVPTREGERARRELALAAELEQALTQLALGPAHVSVELRDPVTAIVIARPQPVRSASEAEAIIAELAGALIPELDPANLHLWLHPSFEPKPEPKPAGKERSWLVMVLCLGLGLSLGVVGERLRMRWVG